MLTRSPTRVVRDYHSDSRQWDDYKPRPGDVIICTAVKVGTTWTQQIVNLLIFQSPKPRPLFEISPWVDARFQMPPPMIMPVLESQTHRRFMKTHLPMDALPIHDEVTYVHTARDGRDACMSWFHHIHAHTAEALARFDEIGLGDPTIGRAMPRMPTDVVEFFRYWLDDAESIHSGWGFFHLEDSYWRERRAPNLLLVHYNDLKADLDGEMRRIAAYLDIAVEEAIWPSLVEAATLDAMKRDGDQLLGAIERGFRGGHRSFLNKGTNKRWQGVIPQADLNRYQAKIEATLTPGLIRWLEAGRGGAGDPKGASD
jgi:aryl sulfotransferase